VAHVDREVTAEEFDRVVAEIQQHFDLDRRAAGIVAEVAISAVSKDLDYYRLSREFFQATSEEERIHFLDTLFAVASADGKVTHDEMEEIRLVANVLKLTHKQYIEAKLKISREQREY
jgi:uncharacterized tellurite resistance protein B-like protein